VDRQTTLAQSIINIHRRTVLSTSGPGDFLSLITGISGLDLAQLRMNPCNSVSVTPVVRANRSQATIDKVSGIAVSPRRYVGVLNILEQFAGGAACERHECEGALAGKGSVMLIQQDRHFT